MATKADVQAHIKQKLIKTKVEEIGSNGAYVKDAVAGNISNADFDAIAGWLQQRDYEKIGRFIGTLVRDKVLEDADTEAASMLADDQLSIVEYARLERMP